MCSWRLLAGLGCGLRSAETVRDWNRPRGEEGPGFSGVWDAEKIENWSGGGGGM